MPAGTEYTILMGNWQGRRRDGELNQSGNAWMTLVSPSVLKCVPAFGAETNIEQLTQGKPQLIITYNGDASLDMYKNAGLPFYRVADAPPGLT